MVNRNVEEALMLAKGLKEELLMLSSSDDCSEAMEALFHNLSSTAGNIAEHLQAAVDGTE